MKYELPKLPYAYDALEPYLDARTMEIHHTKHHQAYTNNLNTAFEKHPEIDTPIEKLLADLTLVPEDIRTAVRNQGGGYWNHAFFWRIMSGPASAEATAGKEPSGKVGNAIVGEFGGFSPFKEAFTKAAGGVFGSGWAWLVLDGKKLAIVQTSNQDCPLSKKQKPLLALDVWEHAYYLKYQNRRPEYIDAWWNVVNWKAVEENFEG